MGNLVCDKCLKTSQSQLNMKWDSTKRSLEFGSNSVVTTIHTDLVNVLKQM